MLRCDFNRFNPTKPGTASSLVSSGIFRITRSPMYVGLSLVLVAWAIFLSSFWSLLGSFQSLRQMPRLARESAEFHRLARDLVLRVAADTTPRSD